MTTAQDLTGLAGSKLAQYVVYSPLSTALSFILILALLHTHNRNPFDPLPLIGHLHIFLSRPRWGHLDWFLAASKYHRSHSKTLDSSSNEGDAGKTNAAGMNWVFKIPGMANSVFTSDPACIKYVLVTKAKEFSKVALFAEFTKDLFGKGILVVEGPHWRMQHQAGKLFALPSTIAHIHDVMIPRGLELMLAKLDAAADSGQIVDLQRWAKDFNLAVLGSMAFEADAELLIDRVAEPFDACLTYIADRFANPFWKITERYTASGRTYRQNVMDVKEALRGLVERAMTGMLERFESGIDVGKGPSLIEALLNAGVEDVDEIVDSCLNYAIAGRDTTAHAMTWTLYQLLENPSILSDLRSSLDAAARPLPASTDPTNPISIYPALVSQLPLLADVCSESLRLHPPIPTEISQHVGVDLIVLPSGQIMRPGEVITWSPWVMARLPSLWGHSAAVFDPSRWGRMRQAGERKSVYEMPTFHAGPRGCLGKDLARVIMMRGVEAVVRRYEIHGVGERKGKLGAGITGEMEGGLQVRLERRTEVV